VVSPNSLIDMKIYKTNWRKIYSVSAAYLNDVWATDNWQCCPFVASQQWIAHEADGGAAPFWRVE